MTESMEYNKAITAGKSLPCALIRSFSAFSLGPTPAVIPEAKELLEARFFSDMEEIRIFHDGEQLRAVRLLEAPEDETVDHVFAIENPVFGKTITLRRTLTFDEDGQAALTAGRLCAWEGEN